MEKAVRAAVGAALLCWFLPETAEAGSDVKSLGMASWYKMGTRTASGERFDPMGITAAHPSLPFGTKVRVTHAGNGQSVVVRINDRGPFGGGRVIDLSLGAAKQIGLHGAGVAKVKLEVLGSSADAAIAAVLPQPKPDPDTATPEPAGVVEPVKVREPPRRLAVERLGGPSR